MATDTLPDDQQEDSDDLPEPNKRFNAVVTSTDWTVQTILEQLRKGNIELNPTFQRREAWRSKRKSQFIESLILGVPVPQIVLAERKNKRGSFIVIDGKQRLLTLRQFCSSEDDNVFDRFILSELAVRTDLNRRDYHSLSTDLALDADFSAFENSTIRTAVIKNWPDENFLYTVFLRLNTGSVPLSPQELRQALHPGKFSKFVDDYSIQSEPLQRALGLSKPDFRMRDAELVIRYYAFINFLPSYKGNLKPLLDETTEFYNKNWDIEFPRIQENQLTFERALHTTMSIFGDTNAFRKWNGNSFERQLNRAVFDVMVIYFSRSNVSEAAIAHAEAVVAAFKDLCQHNDAFRASIEGTTKSIESIHTRLRTWGLCLLQLLQIDFPIARLEENKIHLE